VDFFLLHQKLSVKFKLMLTSVIVVDFTQNYKLSPISISVFLKFKASTYQSICVI